MVLFPMNSPSLPLMPEDLQKQMQAQADTFNLKSNLFVVYYSAKQLPGGLQLLSNLWIYMFL